MEDKTVTLTRDELNAIIKEAYKEGSRETMRMLGLDDEYAVEDIRDLRTFIKAWKNAKKIAGRTVIQYITMAALTIFIAGLLIKLGLSQ